MSASHAGKVYRRRFVPTRLAAPCSPTGRLASPSAPTPPWFLSAIVRTSRSTSRLKSPRSACQSLRAANRPETRNDRIISPCRDEALIVAARNVLVHECAHRRDRLRAIGGERGDVLRWRLDVRWRFHGFVVFPSEVYHRRFENQPAARAVSIAYVLAVRKHGVFCPFPTVMCHSEQNQLTTRENS